MFKLCMSKPSYHGAGETLPYRRIPALPTDQFLQHEETRMNALRRLQNYFSQARSNNHESSKAWYMGVPQP